MTHSHDIDHYLDGRVSVAFCKVCSAEGEKLLESCPQKIEIGLDGKNTAAKYEPLKNEE